MNNTLKHRILGSTVGTKLGAILRCALGANREHDAPRFVGKASVTSDGFIMCSFVGGDNSFHPGAFVGSLADLDDNLEGLSRHLQLPADDKETLLAAVTNWIGEDYRQLGRMVNGRD
jgi:hypothetical protein